MKIYCIVFFALLLSKGKPVPIDLEKGLDIKSMLPNQMLFNTSERPLSEPEIDKIPVFIYIFRSL